jgi:hypothetical protein
LRSGRTRRVVDDLTLHLKGLIHVRALLETRGASAAELARYSHEIARVRGELDAITGVEADARGV